MSPDVRWSRIAALVATLLAAVSIMLIVFSTRTVEPHEPPLQPVLVSAEDQAAILAVVVERCRWMRPPPLSPPNEPAREAIPQDVVLSQQTVTLCEEIDGADTPNCPDHSVVERIPPRMIQELVVGSSKARFQPSGIPGALLATEEALSTVFDHGGWPAFHTTYSNKAGLVRTSWAVAAESGSSAVIFVSFECDGVCGHGDVLLLSRARNGWEAVAEELVWVN